MKITFARALSAALALLMLVSCLLPMTACGNNSDNNDTPSSAVTGTDTEPALVAPSSTVVSLTGGNMQINSRD